MTGSVKQKNGETGEIPIQARIRGKGKVDSYTLQIVAIIVDLLNDFPKWSPISSV